MLLSIMFKIRGKPTWPTRGWSELDNMRLMYPFIAHDRLHRNGHKYNPRDPAYSPNSGRAACVNRQDLLAQLFIVSCLINVEI